MLILNDFFEDFVTKSRMFSIGKIPHFLRAAKVCSVSFERILLSSICDMLWIAYINNIHSQSKGNLASSSACPETILFSDL